MLIPVSGPALAPMAGESQPGPQQAPGPRSEYLRPVFLISLGLVVLACVACVAAALVPWLGIPQPPGAKLARGLGSMVFGREVMAELAGKAPPGEMLLAILPAATAILALAAVFMPKRALRGAMLLGVLIAAAVAWFGVVGWIRSLLPAWSPMVRYVDSPEALAGWTPGPAQVGLGAWIMGGAILVLAGAAAVNLCWSLRGGAVVFGSVLLVGVLGGAHLHHWFVPDRLALLVTASPAKPVILAAGGDSTSEAEVTLSLANQGRRVLVVAAEGGGLPAALGQPDAVLALNRAGEAPRAGGLGAARPRLVLGKRGAGACVVYPGQSAQASAIFSPVWESKHVPHPSLAGKWTAQLRSAADVAIGSAEFDVPAVAHPVDQDITRLLTELQEARAALDAGIAQLGDGGATGSVGDDLRKTFEALRICQERLREIGKHHVLPDDTQKHVANVAEKTGLLGPELLAFFEDLAQGRAETAVRRLAAIQEAAAVGGELGAAVAKRLPELLAQEAAALAQRSRHSDVLRLLTALDQGAWNNPELCRRAAPLLANGTIRGLEAAGLRLVGPDGAVRQSPTGAAGPDAGDQGARPDAPAGAEVYQAALERALAWDRSLETNRDLTYARLVAKKLSGKLTESDVAEFAKANPTLHAEEVECWSGLKALYGGKPKEAARHFAKVLQGSGGAEHAALARLGAALAAHQETEDDVVLRVQAEQRILECVQQRPSWAEDVVRLFPEAVSQGPGAIEWIQGLTLAVSPEQLAAWLGGPRDTVLWLRIPGEGPPPEAADALRKEFTAGKIVLANAPAFNSLNTAIRCEPVGEELLKGTATPVHTPQAEFLSRVTTVSYDASVSEALVPVRLMAQAGPEVQALLQAHKHWHACVARMFRVKDGAPDARGALVFLPDKIRDTPDGRLFLQLLLDFSLEAAARNKGEAIPRPKTRTMPPAGRRR